MVTDNQIVIFASCVRASYGRRGGRPPFAAFRAGSRRHSRTGRETFTSSGSSVRGSLS